MRNKRIVLCEDNRFQRNTLATILAAEGHYVIDFASAEAALEMGHEQLLSMDILLTDFDMPGMNGFELAVEFKGYNPQISVLVVSGHLVSQELIDQIEATFFAKPFSYPELLNKIRHSAPCDSQIV